MRSSFLKSVVRAAVPALLAFSPVAGANELIVPFHSGISLRSAQVSASDPELQVLANALLARNGVRAEDGPEGFHPFATLRVGHRYIVRGEHGTEYRVEVKGASSTAARLELGLAHPHEGEAAPLRARYHLVRYQIADAEPSQPSYPDLLLFTDGSYQMGSAKGSWLEKEGHLAMDGYYAAWGVADISPEQVVFKFARMGLDVKATLERVSTLEGGSAQQASR